MKVYPCAMRGRNPDNPSDRSFLQQRIEINYTGIENCLTTVGKDCMVLIMEDIKWFTYTMFITKTLRKIIFVEL